MIPSCCWDDVVWLPCVVSISIDGNNVLVIWESVGVEEATIEAFAVDAVEVEVVEGVVVVVDVVIPTVNVLFIYT